MTPHESVRFILLDQQILDSTGHPVGRIDDLVVEVGPVGAAPVVTELLTGAQALGERLGGATGQLMAGVAGRLRGSSGPPGPARIPAELVEDHHDRVQLCVPWAELPQVAGLERWLAQHLVGRVRGGGRADQ